MVIFLALKHFLPDLRGYHALVQSDKTSLQTGTPDLLVGSGKTVLPESSLYPWASKSGSRHPAEAGAEAQGMEISPKGGGAHMEAVWPSGIYLHLKICYTVHYGFPSVIQPHSGTDIAEAPRRFGESSLGQGPCPDHLEYGS